MLSPLDVTYLQAEWSSVCFITITAVYSAFQILRKFYAKIFLVQRSPNLLGSPSCSPQVWRRNILCSLPACPPEVQLKFKLKRELFCRSSLAFVASIFNITSGLKSRGQGRHQGSKAKRKGYCASCKELFWTQTMSSGDQSSYKWKTAPCLSPLEPASLGVCPNTLTIILLFKGQGRRGDAFIPNPCPVAFQLFVYEKLFYFHNELIHVHGFHFIYLTTNNSHIQPFEFRCLRAPELHTQQPCWHPSCMSQRHLGLHISQPSV